MIDTTKDSIKSVARVRCNSEASVEVRIYERQVKLPNQWQKFIKNPKRKANLVVFLSIEWNSIRMLPYPDQLLVLGGGFVNKKQAFGITNILQLLTLKIFVVISKKLTQE